MPSRTSTPDCMTSVSSSCALADRTHRAGEGAGGDRDERRGRERPIGRAEGRSDRDGGTPRHPQPRQRAAAGVAEPAHHPRARRDEPGLVPSAQQEEAVFGLDPHAQGVWEAAVEGDRDHVRDGGSTAVDLAVRDPQQAAAELGLERPAHLRLDTRRAARDLEVGDREHRRLGGGRIGGRGADDERRGDDERPARRQQPAGVEATPRGRQRDGAGRAGLAGSHGPDFAASPGFPTRRPERAAAARAGPRSAPRARARGRPARGRGGGPPPSAPAHRPRWRRRRSR